jgi:hypothetical protein
MKALTHFGLLLAITWASAPPAVSAPPENKGNGNLIVHEWGTFLSVQGSDGVTLGGMVDSDEVLPPFVQTRGVPTWQRCRMCYKMETPVTYFYTDRPLDVGVRVEMPKGVLTHWFPEVYRYGPDPTRNRAELKGDAAKSFLEWPGVHVIPATHTSVKENQGPPFSLPKVGPDQTWRFARETDAALLKVRACNEAGQPADQYEKFLFYRGLGKFSLPLEIRSIENTKDGVLSLSLENTSDRPLRSLFAVWVAKDTIRYAALGALGSKASRIFATNAGFLSPQPLALGVSEVKSAIAKGLVAAGLYPKEAKAMVNTWERSYFRTEGLRVLYVLPRETVDEVIPIQIKPAPAKLERVMVGRVELLTPEHERQIEKFVAELGATDFRVRQAATAGLSRLGRIGEPALRRVLATTNDAEVRARAQVLISKFQGG